MFNKPSVVILLHKSKIILVQTQNNLASQKKKIITRNYVFYNMQ